MEQHENRLPKCQHRFYRGQPFEILSIGRPTFLPQDGANEMVYAINKKYNKRHDCSFLPEKRRKKIKALPNGFQKDSANAVIYRILLLILRHREELQAAEAYACRHHVCQSNWNRVR